MMSSKKKINQHEQWMREAIALAGKGIYDTSSNPMVGAVLVKAGRRVGAGYHERYGGPHAEVLAIENAGARARGAALYVTLEPCSTWGKTPPCAAAILNAGIKEVIVGALDPNPKNHGRGVRALSEEKIRVTAGVLKQEVEKQNESFFKFIRTGLPFVTLKMAQSLDGKIATRTGKSRWISSPASREFVHRLRAEQDAILVGKNTLQMDDPFLSPRFPAEKQFGKPWRVAVDPLLETPRNARILKGDQLTLLAVSEKILRRSEKIKNKTGAGLIPVKEKKGKLDLKDLLKKLADLGVAKLLVEGGGELAWSFIDGGFVDKAYWIISSKIIGGRDAKTSVEGLGVEDPNKAFACEIVHCQKLGEDTLLELKVKK